MKTSIVSLLVLLGLCAKTYALSYGDTIPSPDGRHKATYLGSQVRIDDNSVKVLTVIGMSWTGDGDTLAIVEHLAGGSQLSLLRVVDTKWKRIEIDPPLESIYRVSVVHLAVRKHSVRVKYKLIQHNGQEYRFYTCSFDVNPATQARSNEITMNLTAAEYEKLPQFTTQTSINKRAD